MYQALGGNHSTTRRERACPPEKGRLSALGPTHSSPERGLDFFPRDLNCPFALSKDRERMKILLVVLLAMQSSH